MKFSQYSSLLAAALIIATCATLWVGAGRTHLLNCDMECGETVLAVRSVNQFAADGVRYALLENLGDADHPQIYTHSVNIGTLSFVALEALGITQFEHKLLLPLAAYAAGLFYVFLAVRRATGSPLAAIISLTLFCTTYWTLGAFALNALRAWHLLGFFAVVFHTMGLASNPKGPLDTAGLALGALVAFGCGYDFWAICGATALSIIVIRSSASSWRSLVPVAALIVVVFAIPFVLRQIQVILAFGPGYWAQDIIYSLAIKIPYASMLIGIPSIEEIDAWYLSHHVLRPPAYPSNSAVQIFDTARHMISQITIPRWGWLTLLTFLGVLATGVVQRYRRTLIGLLSADLLLPIVLGMAIGLAALAPFTLHVYLKHEFPLVAFPLLLAKAIVIYALISWAAASWRKAALAGTAIALFVGDAAMVHWNNTANGHYSNFAWADYVREHPEKKYTVASVRYAQWSSADPILGLDKADITYISPSDAMDVVGESWDGVLIYQPTERISDFDAPVPTCAWRDWMTALLRDPPVANGRGCIYGAPLPETTKRQPTLEEITAAARNARVVQQSHSGIGYVILENSGPAALETGSKE